MAPLAFICLFAAVPAFAYADDKQPLTPFSPIPCFPASFVLLLKVGDYDVLIPQRTPGGMYRIRVGVFADDTVFGCSVPFEVIPLPADKWSEDLWV